MAIIIRPGELLTIKLDDVTIYLAPISRSQKTKIYKECTTRKGGEEVLNAEKLAELIIRASVKRVDSLADVYGDEIKVKLEKEMLTSDSYEMLFQLNRVDRLVTAAQLSFSGEIGKIRNIEGVEIVIPKRKGPKRKA